MQYIEYLDKQKESYEILDSYNKSSEGLSKDTQRLTHTYEAFLL